MKPSVLVLRTAGTNCERETAHAFELVGAATETLHVARCENLLFSINIKCWPCLVASATAMTSLQVVF